MFNPELYNACGKSISKSLQARSEPYSSLDDNDIPYLFPASFLFRFP